MGMAQWRSARHMPSPPGVGTLFALRQPRRHAGFAAQEMMWCSLSGDRRNAVLVVLTLW
jgi:hypothetical protein